MLTAIAIKAKISDALDLLKIKPIQERTMALKVIALHHFESSPRK
jgi:hypothetical protein